MGLEDILTALEFSMNDRLDEIDDDLLSAEGVEDVLITYSLEKEARPELTEVITLRGVMNNFLNLSLEDREGVEEFRQENPGYLEGEGKEKRFSGEVSGGVCGFVREQRWTSSLLEFFDFYLDNRVDGEMFNANYLISNEKLKEEFGSKPNNLYINAKRNFSDSGKLDHLIDLAVKDRPEIKQYGTFKGLLGVDGTRDLLQFFDFYLDNRVDGEIFNTNYLTTNKKLKSKFGSKPKNLYFYAARHFHESGRLDHLINLALLDRPRIKQYTTRSGLLEVDGLNELLTYFDFYLDNRVDSQIFGPGYLTGNERLKNEFGSKPQNLYDNTRDHFSDSGKLDHLIDLAVKDRPNIKQYTTKFGLLEVDGSSEFITYFDFYLDNRVDGEMFNTNYLINNEKLKSKFGSKPGNLYLKTLKHFSETGRADHLVKLASEERPEILDYWRNGALKSSGGFAA